MYQSTSKLEEIYDFVRVDKNIYKEVFSGEVKCTDLEDIYVMFNGYEIARPPDYSGRSMCVSDVVEVIDGNFRTAPGLYYCDSIGFKQVDFCDGRNYEKPPKITVLQINPGEEAKVMEINTSLKSLQNAVGGYIETYYPFNDSAVLVCNDEGKLNGMKPNRGIYDEKGELMDIIFGPFFICDASGPNFESLSKEQISAYMGKFREPEKLSRINGQYVMTKISKQQERGR